MLDQVENIIIKCYNIYRKEKVTDEAEVCGPLGGFPLECEKALKASFAFIIPYLLGRKKKIAYGNSRLLRLNPALTIEVVRDLVLYGNFDALGWKFTPYSPFRDCNGAGFSNYRGFFN